MNAAPRPLYDQTGLLSPPLALSGGALALAGALLAGAPLTDWRLYPVAVGAMLLHAAGHAFTRFFATARPQPGPDRRLPDEAQQAWKLGWLTLLPGAALPALGGRAAWLAAIGVALLLVLYASATRTEWGLGFANFGAARALTLVLGLCLAESGLERYWNVALPVLVWAMGWDVLRSARQPGAPRTTGFVALAHLVGAVSLALYQAAWSYFHWTDAFVPLILLLAVAFPRFVSAVMLIGAPPVLQAVQYGLIGEVLLAAVLVAGYNNLLPGLAVAALVLPLFKLLERWPVALVMDPR